MLKSSQGWVAQWLKPGAPQLMDNEIQNHLQSLGNPEASDGEKKNAASKLANLAVINQNKAAIVAAGGIPALIALVASGSDSAKQRAADALGTLALGHDQSNAAIAAAVAMGNDQNKAAIAAAGGIPALIDLVRIGRAKEYAALALGILAMNDQNKATLATAGGIPPLIALVTNGTDSEKQKAADALANLARNDQNKATIAAAGGIPSLVELLQSGSDSAKEEAADALSWNDQNSAAIIAADGIPPLVPFVTNGIDDGKQCAARALRILASSNGPNKAIIADAGGIPPLVELLKSGSDSAKEEAADALAILAWNDKNKEAVAAAGGIPPLIALVTNGSDSAKQKAADALANLAWNDQNSEAIATAGGIPPLVELLKSGSDSAKQKAALALSNLAWNEQNSAAIVAADGIPLLVPLVTNGIDDGKQCAARALGILASRNGQNKAAIAAAGGVEALQEMAKYGKILVHRQVAQEALKHFPHQTNSAVGGTKLDCVLATKPSTTACAEKLVGEIGALESGSEEQKAKAAEQLGTWAAVSDENRVAISREGGAEALVAVLVTGSDDAKWHAARAMRNLANNCEAKEVILKAEGIATLKLVVRHGKGKVKEAADEALKLLSQKEETQSARDTIPTGEGTRVAMFSARFDGGPIEQKIRKVFQILCDRKYDILMVAADAGQSFGDLTTKYLGRLHKEKGTMIAVCTKHYGEMTASAYSSHKELKFALAYEKFVTVLPLRVDDTYPPEPPGGPGHAHDKEYLAQGYILSVFKPDVVFLECREKSEIEIAAQIANALQSRKVAKDGSS